MRILHLSHESLPDWRVEKSAQTALKNGHDVMFAGKIPQEYESETFSKIFEVNWTAGARYGLPYHWHVVKKQVKKVLRDAKPDVVHTHNLFSAKMMSELYIPFIYDDHEHWARHSQLLSEMTAGFKFTNPFSIDSFEKIKRQILNRYLVCLWTRWERDIVTSTPTIAVSTGAAKDLRLLCQNSYSRQYVVPNYPTLSENAAFGVEPAVPYHEFLRSVYAGSDGHNLAKYPHRNLEGLEETYESSSEIGKLTIMGWTGKIPRANVSFTGFLPRKKMFEEMRAYSVGLLPWKKHWFHRYCSPNKAYDYANSGLVIACTSSLTNVIESLKGNCIVFEDFKELASCLKDLRTSLNETYKKRKKTFEFARSHLVWEKVEGRILEAYQQC